MLWVWVSYQKHKADLERQSSMGIAQIDKNEAGHPSQPDTTDWTRISSKFLHPATHRWIVQWEHRVIGTDCCWRPNLEPICPCTESA